MDNRLCSTYEFLHSRSFFHFIKHHRKRLENFSLKNKKKQKKRLIYRLGMYSAVITICVHIY